MKTCVFVGPSAGDVVLPAGVDRFAPAAMGAVWRAVEEGYRRIALVDGLFGAVPAVWHKEVLYALSRGVLVYGASSMGALRAAELSPFGMRGVGAIYRLYRSGRLTDDDEVCLVHAPREQGFVPLTLPMVNVRRTLGRMRRAGEITPARALGAAARLKHVHFSLRDVQSVKDALAQAGAGEAARASFRRRHEDLKTLDYAALARALARPEAGDPRTATLPPWRELETFKWHTQFVEEPQDIPALERW